MKYILTGLIVIGLFVAGTAQAAVSPANSYAPVTTENAKDYIEVYKRGLVCYYLANDDQRHLFNRNAFYLQEHVANFDESIAQATRDSAYIIKESTYGRTPQLARELSVIVEGHWECQELYIDLVIKNKTK
jgi:hypothetical protein